MILVTGGAGFIGSNFVLGWIEATGESLVNLDKLTYAGNLRNLAALEGDGRHRFVRGDIGDALAGVIFVEGDLLRFGAAFLVAGENLTDFDQLVPADHAAVDRIVNVSLLVLNRLLDRDDAVDVAARQSRIIDFTPFCRREPALHETDIAADDRRYMLAGFEPIAIEDRHAGIGRGQHDIDAAHSLFR